MRILTPSQNLRTGSNCYIACQIGSSPIENFDCRATPFSQRVASLVVLPKSQRKDFSATLELGLSMILTDGMWNSFKADGRMRNEKQKVTG